MGIEKYGHIFEDPWALNPVNIELWAFANWLDTDRGGLGRYQHLKNAISMLWPDMEFNEWFELRMRQFCAEENWVVSGNSRFLSINNVGCATSGKTHDWVVIGLVWWLSDPTQSRFTFCSAQKQMVPQRSWAVLQQCYNSLPAKPGHMIGSKYIVQAVKGDSKHCVDITGCGNGGDTDRAVQRLAGNHPRRYMIVVDEASETPEAIFATVPNASKACDEFIFVTAGNAWKRLDPLGRCCEPIGGWHTVNKDTEVWRTKGVREWDIKPGVAIHFSARRSPNVKKKKTHIRYLYTYENWLGVQGTEDTAKYWIQDEGFWAPEGISNTVLDEATIIKAGATGTFEWVSRKEAVGALDPAFGGDDCKLKFGEVGDIDSDGRIALCVRDTVPIRIDERSRESVEMQIAQQVMRECQKRGVKPECFGLDCTGSGRGVASYLQDLWSPMILKVEFGGAPSDAPVSQDDYTSRKDAYDRKVTELAMTLKEMVISGQLRGLDHDTVVQCTSREYTYKGRRLSIEKKEDMRKRINRSPDDMDCVEVMCAVAESRGLAIKGGTGQGTLMRQRSLVAEAARVNDVLPDEGEEELSWNSEADYD